MTAELRKGYTTGLCAAAAAKASAIMLFGGRHMKGVEVTTGDGQPVRMEVSRVSVGPGWAECCVIKDAGDDPDVTNGLLICARVSRAPITASPGGRVKITGGRGVGVVTKPGLAAEVGGPAINPVPRRMIAREVEQVLPPGEAAKVEIFVPEGERVARRTLNPRLGIVGGISILGTSGIVEPMSQEAFKRSLLPQIDVALAAGFEELVLVPGRKGLGHARDRYGLPDNGLIMAGNFWGYMLEACADRGVRGVLLMGHHAKLVKLAAGVFHTHSRVADARLETIAAYAALMGAGPEVIRPLLSSATGEAAIQVLRANGLMSVFSLLAERASQRAMDYVGGRLHVATALLSLRGELLGCDARAMEMARRLGSVL